MDEVGLTDLIVDKGIPDPGNVLNGERELGVSPTFELKIEQYGMRGSDQGCLEFDGRLWLPPSWISSAGFLDQRLGS
jgi:hypothetical protein